jgi:hypothetical protein
MEIPANIIGKAGNHIAAATISERKSKSRSKELKIALVLGICEMRGRNGDANG